MRAPSLLHVVIGLASAASCSGSGEQDARSGPAATLVATGGPGDVIVAQVNGRPVWGSCVTAQAHAQARTAQPTDHRAALDECIAFELLAQAAEARGLATDPEVGEQARTALVDRLVEVGFEQRYRTPEDLPEVMAKVIERSKHLLARPELRASAYARIEIPLDAPPERDARARELAGRIAATLADETGLFPINLKETADRLAQGTELVVTHAPVSLMTRESLVETYATALFAIADVGRIAPAAVRTKWGWDIILLTERLEPRTITAAQLAAEAFPDVRRSYFQVWVNQIIKSLGITIHVDPAQVERLDEGGS